MSSSSTWEALVRRVPTSLSTANYSAWGRLQ